MSDRFHFAVRCFSCGRVLARKSLWLAFLRVLSRDEPSQSDYCSALDATGLRLKCCRGRFAQQMRFMMQDQVTARALRQELEATTGAAQSSSGADGAAGAPGLADAEAAGAGDDAARRRPASASDCAGASAGPRPRDLVRAETAAVVSL